MLVLSLALALGSNASFDRSSPPIRVALALEGDVATLRAPACKSSLNLHLAEWGRVGELHPAEVACTLREEHGLTLQRDGLREWFRDDFRGVEHGFDVLDAPSGDRHGRALRLALEWNGPWNASVFEGGRSASFLDADGGTGYLYRGLRAWDANGRELDASLAIEGERLLLDVDDHDALYPLTIDPIVVAQTAHLHDASGATGDFYGSRIGIDGDTCVIGARERFGGFGGAYIYRNVNGGWLLEADLFPSDLMFGDKFGWDVAIEGDTVAVSTPLAIRNGINSGAVYIFTRSGSTWTQAAEILPSPPQDSFGGAIDLSGNTLVVSGDKGGPVPNAGLTTVFVGAGSTWTEQAKLQPLDATAPQNHGANVKIDGDVLVVSASLDDDLGTLSGSVYVWRRTGTVWTNTQKLHASNGDAQDQFGTMMDIDGGTLVVGAYNAGPSTAQGDGAAYIFEDGPSGFVEQLVLTTPDHVFQAWFGLWVGVSGDRIAIGAPNVPTGTLNRGGAAYLYERIAGTWNFQMKVYPEPGTLSSGAGFGQIVALDGNRLLVGAPFNAIPGGSPTPGTVFVFEVQPSAFTLFCAGDGFDPFVTTNCPCNNKGGFQLGCRNSVSQFGSRLLARGSTAIDPMSGTDTVVLRATYLPLVASTSVIFLQGDAVDAGGSMFGDGVRCVAGSLIRVGSKPSPSGSAEFPEPGNLSVSQRGAVTPGSGVTRGYQAYYRNASAAFCPPETFNITNGVSVDW